MTAELNCRHGILACDCQDCVEIDRLRAENAALKEKYEGQRPKCHSGHENILPLALWDCPMCSDERRKENTKLRVEFLRISEMLQEATTERDKLREALKDIACGDTIEPSLFARNFLDSMDA